MSASGQKRTFRRVAVMSALPPKPEIAKTRLEGTLFRQPVPVATNSPRVDGQRLFPDATFVAAFEHGGRYRELSFSERRNLFSDHSLSFGIGPCTAFG